VEEFRGHLHDYFAGMGELRRDYGVLAELNGGEASEVVVGNTYRN
jgi:hypothetical protein